MRKGSKVKQLGKKKSHRDLMFKNQMRDLAMHGKLVTTTPKAKELKRRMQKLFGRLAGNGDKLVLRRELMLITKDKDLTDRLFDYVEGGNYAVSIVRVGFRPGDNAQLSRVSLLNYAEEK